METKDPVPLAGGDRASECVLANSSDLSATFAAYQLRRARRHPRRRRMLRHFGEVAE